jgi:capsular polysaccharide biosynthesis protein
VVDAVQILRTAIRPTATAHPPERIYISRRDIESFRYMRGEDEVEAVMKRLGFTIVRPQELAFDEQVATFARARVIVGPHGAGMTNAAFAPAGCLVFDICPDIWTSRWMVQLTQMFGHQYLPVTFPSDAGPSNPILFDNATIGPPQFFTVQTDNLTALLVRAMQELGDARARIGDAIA